MAPTIQEFKNTAVFHIWFNGTSSSTSTTSLLDLYGAYYRSTKKKKKKKKKKNFYGDKVTNPESSELPQ